MAINLKRPWNIGWNGGGDFNVLQDVFRGYLAELLLTYPNNMMMPAHDTGLSGGK